MTPITSEQIAEAARLDKEATQDWRAIHGDSYCAYPSILRGCKGPHFILLDASEPDGESADKDFKSPGADIDADAAAFFRNHGPQAFKELQEAREEISRLQSLHLDRTKLTTEAVKDAESLRAKLDAAKAAIEAAPHGTDCLILTAEQDDDEPHPKSPRCTCWKAAALREIGGVKATT